MTPRSRRRVLVVEDSEPLARMLVEVLRSESYAATWVSSGAAAMDAAEEERPHVVLMDLNLGDVDGFQVARKLRALPGMESARVIGLSGDPVPPRRRRFLDGFLLKPVALPDLLSVLRN